MSCINCDKQNFNIISMPCAVCDHVSKDKSPKRVVWCDVCQAYICEKHIDDWPARALAFSKNTYKKIKERAEKIIR